MSTLPTIIPFTTQKHARCLIADFLFFKMDYSVPPQASTTRQTGKNNNNKNPQSYTHVQMLQFFIKRRLKVKS